MITKKEIEQAIETANELFGSLKEDSLSETERHLESLKKETARLEAQRDSLLEQQVTDNDAEQITAKEMVLYNLLLDRQMSIVNKEHIEQLDLHTLSVLDSLRESLLKGL